MTNWELGWNNWMEYDSKNSFEMILIWGVRRMIDEKIRIYILCEKRWIREEWLIYDMSCCEHFGYMEYIWINLIERVEQKVY